MMESKTFEEFVAKRCEEILKGNEAHNLIDEEILACEKKFKELLNENQLKAYLKLESIVCNQINYDEQLIYKSASKEGGCLVGAL